MWLSPVDVYATASPSHVHIDCLVSAPGFGRPGARRKCNCHARVGGFSDRAIEAALECCKVEIDRRARATRDGGMGDRVHGIRGTSVPAHPLQLCSDRAPGRPKPGPLTFPCVVHVRPRSGRVHHA
jgi:hypothetical protein